MAEKKFLNTVILEDHPIVADAIEQHLEKYCNTFCIKATKLESLLTMSFNNSVIDLWVIDLQFGKDMNWNIISSLQQANPATTIMVYTMFDTPWIAAKLKKCGIRWAVSKSDPVEELDKAIESMLDDKNYYSSSLTLTCDEHEEHTLTSRQIKILKCIIDGKTTGETAEEMGITENTVLTYRKQLMAKFGVHKVADLVKVAAGLV